MKNTRIFLTIALSAAMSANLQAQVWYGSSISTFTTGNIGALTSAFLPSGVPVNSKLYIDQDCTGYGPVRLPRLLILP